jgi:hypothetical protein
MWMSTNESNPPGRSDPPRLQQSACRPVQTVDSGVSKMITILLATNSQALYLYIYGVTRQMRR